MTTIQNNPNENAKDVIVKVLTCIASNPMNPYPIPGNQGTYYGVFVPGESKQAQRILDAVLVLDKDAFRVAANMVGVKFI